jgi:hypothetical protein
VALRIAFDLDGVLADMQLALAREAERLFGERVNQHPPTEADKPAADASTEPRPPVALDLTPRQQNRLWRHVEAIEDFWVSLKEIEPGIVARLAAIAVARRWEVIFLTRRPQTAGATAQVQTQRWLEAAGFALPSVYVVQGSRGRIAQALGLDVVVDDRVENCLDVVADSHARAILVWREAAKLLPETAGRLGIGVVKSVAECLDILDAADAAEKPGVIERVKRLLRLKEPASA